MTRSVQRVLRMTGDQHRTLKSHLLPGDGAEAVAVALCGRHMTDDRHILSVHKLKLIPYEACQRHPLRVSWPTGLALDLIKEAAAKGMSILKIHSHPGWYPQFSEADDASDGELFPSIHGWTDDNLPHASAVMLPDGSIFGRFARDGEEYAPINRISIAGDDILIFDGERSLPEASEEQLRTRQAFGDQTTGLISGLRVGLVGCSGTGSWVAEQLARLGVGELILVDPDRVERKNLNRIIGTKKKDADAARLKVEVLAEGLESYGTGTSVTRFPELAFMSPVVNRLAACDVLFGCMDKVEGRELLNRISVFYSVPYFDIGVQLRADGKGGVETVCGSVHFLVPGGSSLLSRGVYTAEMLRAESLQRTDPEAYKREVEEGYIRNAAVESPAVVSVNGFCASMAVNEFLARLHPFRHDPNGDYRWQQLDLVNSYWQGKPCDEPCPVLSRWAGRGQMRPPLNCGLVSE